MNEIKSWLGEALYQDFLEILAEGYSEAGAYFYTLFLSNRLGSLISSDNWVIFSFDSDEKQLFKLEKDFGAFYFGKDPYFPDFHQLDAEEVNKIIKEEIEKMREKDD